MGGCIGDDRAAYAYPSTSGWAPWVRCHHRSCGYRTSIFDILTDRLGVQRAAEAIRAAVDGKVVAHCDPAARTRSETKRAQPSRAGRTQAASAVSAAAEELERHFPSGVLVTRSESFEPVAAIVLSAEADTSKTSGCPMLVLELGLMTIGGAGRAPLFLPDSMPTFQVNTLRVLVPEVIDSDAETLDLDVLPGRQAIAHVRLEVGDYGPRTDIGYLTATPGLFAPDLVALVRRK